MKQFAKSLISGALTLAATTILPIHAAPDPAPASTNTVSVKADPAGDKAWADIEQALKPPSPPAEWNQKRPSNEEIRAFNEKQTKVFNSIIDKLHDFYIKFPQHPKATDARNTEYEFLQTAARMGLGTRSAELQARQKERAQDSNSGEDARFEARMMEVQKAAIKKRPEGEAVEMAELEKGIRQLQKEFPTRAEVYELLLVIASRTEDVTKAKALAEEIGKSNAGDQIKEGAADLLKKLGLIGKPVVIKFKAIDGREVDTTKLTNKVVLIDFWATWCGPCILALPDVKAAYDQFHAKGFDVVGISLDQDKSKLESFVAERKMAWPQYFDGKGWQNKYTQKFGITGIPAMWLLDKKGNLRDVNGRDDLAAKVEKMLAK